MQKKYKSLDHVITYDKTSKQVQQLYDRINQTDSLDFKSFKLPFNQLILPLLLSNEKKLTQGSFADIYTVEYKSREYVMRKLQQQRTQNQVDVEKFIRETKLFYWIHENVSVDSCHVMKLCGWYHNESNRSWINLMDKMYNGDVFHFIEQHDFSIISYHQRLKWCLQLSIALCTIHSRNYIHLDFKSLNILVDDKFDLYVTDLSDMKHQSFFSSEVTNENFVFQPQGTIFWMSPEIMRLADDKANAIAVTVQSDIYSLAIVLHEIFTWKKPYEGFNSLQILEKLKNDEQYRMDISDSVPQVIRELIQQCWHSDPQQRPSSQELVHTFEQLVANEQH
jgi:serine/threonine protein kinase